MQVKKEDIKNTIVTCAIEEFLMHGYDDASMRTIAKKSNTSLGNIYHYFPNKKALLDYILKPKVYKLCEFIRNHAKTKIDLIELKELEEAIEGIDFEAPQMKLLLSKEFVIFMETKDQEYVDLKNKHIALFQQHIGDHLKFKANSHFISIITKMVIDCVIHMIRCNECMKDKQRDMIDMFKIVCRTVAINDVDIKRIDKDITSSDK